MPLFSTSPPLGRVPDQKAEVTLVDNCCVRTSASTRQLQVHFDEEHGVWYLAPPPVAVVVATASDKKIDSTSAGGAPRPVSQQMEEDLETSSTAAEHRLSTSERASNASGDEGGQGFVGSASSGKSAGPTPIVASGGMSNTKVGGHAGGGSQSADQSLLHDDENVLTEPLLTTSCADGICLPVSGSESANKVRDRVDTQTQGMAAVCYLVQPFIVAQDQYTSTLSSWSGF